MGGRHSYSTQRWRGVHTERIVSRSQLLPPEPPAPPPRKPRRERVSKGHVKNVLKDLKKVRKARRTGKPPRGAKRKSLETIVTYKLE